MFHSNLKNERVKALNLIVERERQIFHLVLEHLRACS